MVAEVACNMHEWRRVAENLHCVLLSLDSIEFALYSIFYLECNILKWSNFILLSYDKCSFQSSIFLKFAFLFLFILQFGPYRRRDNEERESTAMAATSFCFDVWKRRKEERGMYFNFDEGRRKANSK